MDPLRRLELEVAVLELEAGALVALAAAGFPPNLTRAPSVAEVRSRTTFAGIEGDVDQAAARAVGVALRLREDVLRLLLIDVSATATGTQEVLRRLDALVAHTDVLPGLAELVADATDQLRGIYAEASAVAAARFAEDARAAGLTLLADPVPDEAVALAQARRVAAEAGDAAVRAARGAAHATARPFGTTLQDFVRQLATAAVDVGTKGLEDVATQGALAANGAGRTGAGGVVADDDGMSWYASALLDRATCGPCNTTDGREYATRAEALEDFPEGRNARCKGGDRCRCTLVAVPATETRPTLQAPGVPEAPAAPVEVPRRRTA